jgi:GNAT superfamily N-acetyltransferase
MTEITVTDKASPDEVDAIFSGLSAFNNEAFGPGNRLPLVVLIRDDAGAIKAGINGFTGWGWLFTQWLWVDDSLRGQGLATKMLEAAEAEALRRGCTGAWIDTFNPVALKIYQRHGYKEFGHIEDFPEGHNRTFLQKRLTAPVDRPRADTAFRSSSES